MKRSLVSLLFLGALTFMTPQISYGEISTKSLVQPKKLVLTSPDDIQSLGFKYHSYSDATLNLMNIVCLKNGWYKIDKICSDSGYQYNFTYDYLNLDFEQPLSLEILDSIDKNNDKFLTDGEIYRNIRKLELDALKSKFPEEFKEVKLDSINY